jgi:hypothetical protein
VSSITEEVAPKQHTITNPPPYITEAPNLEALDEEQLEVVKILDFQYEKMMNP